MRIRMTFLLSTFLSLLLLVSAHTFAQRKATPAEQYSGAARQIANSSQLPQGTLASVLLQEDFSSASGSTPPAGWTNNTIDGLITDIWRFDNPGNRTVSFSSTQPTAVFDSDFLSLLGGAENVALESPAFNVPFNSSIVLTFKQYYRSNQVDDQSVIVEVFDGVQWTIVDSTKFQTSDPANASIDISNQVAGVSNARIRFRFKGNSSWFWFVDDIVVTETPLAPSSRLLLENFKAASGSTPPSGWVMNRMVGASYDEWRYDNPGGRTLRLPITAPSAIFDSDSLSRLGDAEDVALESPEFSAPANATITLTLDHFFRGDSGGRATIEVFNGTTWVSCWDSTHSTPNPETLSINITSFVEGVSNAKVRFRWRGWWSWWWIIDNISIIQTPTGGGASDIASDQFNDLTLNAAVWTFENPLGDGSYVMTGTQLSISVPAGTSHDITETGNNAPRVMQAVSNPANFELYVKFDTLMNLAYQTQGIQIWEDALNFLRLEFYADGTNLNRLAWDFVNGTHVEQGSASLGITPTAPIYMKVTRQGDTWTQYWSTDGVNYTLGTTFTRTMNVTKVGVYAGNVGFPESSAPAFTCFIDYIMTTDPLPIRLARFSAIATSNTRVQLDWTSLTETNNYGFEIQKSQNTITGFLTLPNSFTPGHGTTIEPHNYTWTDEQAISGTWYYRLKQIDLDGSINYSDPIQVDVVTGVDENSPKHFALYQNYPNPFNPSTEIKFSVENTAPSSLEVYNTLGQKVATLFQDVAEAGTFYTVRFDASNLSSGMYFYKLESGTRSSVKKLLLMK